MSRTARKIDNSCCGELHPVAGFWQCRSPKFRYGIKLSLELSKVRHLNPRHLKQESASSVRLVMAATQVLRPISRYLRSVPIPTLAFLSFFGSTLIGAEIDYTNAYKDRMMEAVRVEGKIVVDGILDEPEWELAEPATNFIQKLPATGETASELTEVRLLYDEDNLYVGVYCFDSAGPSGIVVNDISKDFDTRNSDGFQIVIDTYNDNRNGFLFATNPAAGRFDMQVGGDGNRSNRNWDGIWDVRTKVTEDGWQVEMVIPFKTLRFRNKEEQVWGVNYERRVRRKFEDSHWSALPPQFRTSRVSLAGTLNGIEGVQQGRNAYFKPYVKIPFLRREDDDWDLQPAIGLEVFKWAVTPQLTFDATLNTDFSQVEADDVRVNLTRFSLFFPEKRDFFLENADIFAWGRSERGPGGGRSDLLPFHSRRIGLTEDREIVPILGGGRLTGRAGAYTLGFLSMQTGEYGEDPPEDSLDPRTDTDDEEEDEYTPSTNFTVARIRRDILRQSDFGGIFVNKQEVDGSYNRTYGFDANFNFFRYLDIGSYILNTDTPDLEGENLAGNAQANWDDGFFELQAGHLRIGDNFNPEVGFVRREGIHKTRGEFGITPRPRERIRWIREFNPQIRLDYITNTENVLETRQIDGSFSIEFSESSRFRISRESNFERLEEDDDIHDIVIPAGDYWFDETQVSFRSNPSKILSFDVEYGTGGFWDGDRDSYELEINFQPSYKFGASIGWEHNDVALQGGSFRTDVVSSRLIYSMSNNMWFNALIQYDGDEREVISNLRFNWMFKPLSDLYVVYNERRTSDAVLERAIILKLTYVLPL
jgi:hypothetical protein